MVVKKLFLLAYFKVFLLIFYLLFVLLSALLRSIIGFFQSSSIVIRNPVKANTGHNG